MRGEEWVKELSTKILPLRIKLVKQGRMKSISNCGKMDGRLAHPLAIFAKGRGF
jgi:hypothetical protein